MLGGSPVHFLLAYTFVDMSISLDLGIPKLLGTFPLLINV
jgi:hypothetical protein